MFNAIGSHSSGSYNQKEEIAIGNRKKKKQDSKEKNNVATNTNWIIATSP